MIVAAEAVDTRASKAVQAAVLGRIQKFGDGTAPPMHRARVTVSCWCLGRHQVIWASNTGDTKAEPSSISSSSTAEEPATGCRNSRLMRRRINRCRCCTQVPAAVAHILAREPQLVAPAVETFYFRDVAAMKVETYHVALFHFI